MHVIRLRGPWKLTLPDGTCSRSVALPLDVATLMSEAAHLPQQVDRSKSASFALHRGFHCPTGLGSVPTVFLALATPLEVLDVTLNGTKLACASDDRLEIGGMLEPRNELSVQLRLPDELVAGSVLEAQLEIEE